jgi:putative transposase
VVTGHRHGSRTRTLTGTFGKTEIAVRRARLNTSDGKTREWKSQGLRNYQRRTLAADALIAGTYLAGPTRAACAAPCTPCSGGAVGKGTMSHQLPSEAHPERSSGRCVQVARAPGSRT